MFLYHSGAGGDLTRYHACVNEAYFVAVLGDFVEHACVCERCRQELACRDKVCRLRSVCELWSQSLGFSGMTVQPPPQFRETSLLVSDAYPECVSSFQPPLVFNMIILTPRFLCCLLYLCFFLLTLSPSPYGALSGGKQLSFIPTPPRPPASSVNGVGSGLLINVPH